ncbi:hypothetical protein [Streptomyces palmae]|uniref:Uncharacterized protein n=1 Tax=Streptomyces palmae TaxID=1701085 RepID=A0A4Z0HK77_9ACTN|nr:hypothetical protein [Streptomyces palmae]TGB19368.1 hypothetical protein E4099_00610 [Streptomyces palmae]
MTSTDGFLLTCMVVAICVSLLVLVALFAWMPSGQRGVTPPLDEPGGTYTCLCWQAPVRVEIAPRIPPGRGRHARGRSPDHRSRR